MEGKLLMSKQKIAMLTGMAVMVLFGDSILLADPLDHWAKRNSEGQTNTLNAVLFGNSLFVANDGHKSYGCSPGHRLGGPKFTPPLLPGKIAT